MTAVETVERTQLTTRPAIKPGDTVRVHVKVREGDKERIQVFEGMVIGMHRGGARATFTVRKVSFGQGVERIFPLHSPIIDKIDVVRTAQVRRAKLYFLRDLKGKAARMKEREEADRLGARFGRGCMVKVRAFRTHGERHPADGVRLRRRRGRGRPRLPGRAGRRGGGGAQSRPLRSAHLRLEDRDRARARPALRPDHHGTAVAWGVASASCGEIDTINIHQASLRAMQRAVPAPGAVPGFRAGRRLPDSRPAHGAAGGHPRRQPVHGHRRRLDRRQGHARPDDAGTARRRPALRLRSPQGLRDPGTSATRLRSSATLPVHRQSFRPPSLFDRIN